MQSSLQLSSLNLVPQPLVSYKGSLCSKSLEGVKNQSRKWLD